MGIFNPFSYWPLAPSKDNNSADDTAETTKYQPGNSWAIVNCDQTTSNVNSTSIASPDTTPSPTELAAASKEKPDHDEPGPEHRTGNRFSLRPKLSLDTTVGRPVRRHAEQQRPVGVIGSRHAGEAAPAGGARSSKQSWRGSKRLNGLKTILRVRKGQEQLKQQFNAESSSMGFFGQGPGDPAHGDLGRDPGVEDHGDQDQDQDVCNSATKESQYGDPLEVPETSEIPPVPSIPPMLPNSSISPIPPIPPIPQLLQLPHLPQLPEMNRLYDYGEDNDTRRVSDRSAQSKDSNATSSTVLHRASVCPVDQVPLTDRGYRYENPFEELHELCGIEKQGPPPLPEQSSLLVPGQQDDNRQRTFSNDSDWRTWSTDIDQHEALKLFNDMAYELCLRPVSLESQSSYLKAKKSETIFEEKLGTAGRRSGIIHRIRTMRSNIQLRSQSLSPEPDHRRVRRMKTFANLSSRPEPFVALKGKSLETLCRLGGYTVLKLPGDFVPASLKLPVCIGSTALFLKGYSRKVPNVFFDPGDVKTGARTYEHFASQVLQAEREEDRIQMTMRRSQIPQDPLERVDHEEASRQRPSYVLSIAWVFKALLAGIPDGILGSEPLYQTLVDISYGRTPRLSSEGDPVRPGSCLEGLTTWEDVKTKAIALAMLALTSKMHLELICGVFGLFSVLLHETQREVETEWVTKVRTRAQRPSWAAGLLDVNWVSRVLGPLLTNREEYDAYESQCGRVPSLLTGERVVRMLVEDWRGVSRQLRWWGRCGCPPMQVVIEEQGQQGDEEKDRKENLVAEKGGDGKKRGGKRGCLNNWPSLRDQRANTPRDCHHEVKDWDQTTIEGI